ncbi:exo-alpha-sialidase, partial [Bacillus velezensis]|nr:exo-alpha-sialidase [Bacillus velezensis]
GTYCLYLSDDFGVTWHVAKPFSQLKEPPVIRSLCLHGQTIYIGTRIHMNHGGIWAYDLTEGRIRRISR